MKINNNTKLRFLNEEEAKKVEEFKNDKLKQLNLNKEEIKESIDTIDKEEVYLNAIYDDKSVLREIKVVVPNDDNFKSTMLSLLDKLIM